MTNEEKLSRILKDEPEYWGDLKELCKILRSEVLLCREELRCQSAVVARLQLENLLLQSDANYLKGKVAGMEEGEKRLRQMWHEQSKRLEHNAETLRREAEWMKSAMVEG